MQDAIEDAQYLTAVHDDSPKPTSSWPKYKTEELNAFIAKQRLEGKGDLEGICAGSLGFYMVSTRCTINPSPQPTIFLLTHSNPHTLSHPFRPIDQFTRFLRQRGDERAIAMSSFLLDVAAFRLGMFQQNNETASAAAVKLIERYLEVPKNKKAGKHSRSGGDAGAEAGTEGDGEEGLDALRPPGLFRKLTASVAPDGNGSNNNSSSSSSNNSSGSGGSSLVRWEGAVLAAPYLVVHEARDAKKSGSLLSVTPADRQAMASSASAAAAAAAATANGEQPNILGLSGEACDAVRARLPSLIASSSDALAFVDRNSFDALDAIVFSCLRDKVGSDFEDSQDFREYFSFMYTGSRRVQETDFTLFRVLGRGGFGMVNACKRSASGKLYAMKAMNKQRIKTKKAENFCLNERNILAAIDSPFVVCLKYSFANSKELFLILDLMMGGDLGYHLQRKGKFSTEETLYYSSRIIAGIAALHDLGIVYRDLKPENVLMDEFGYTRISDLGLSCKVGKSGLSGACGTRGYWAPEMLRKDSSGKRERYHLQVDWFSFGCCLYEFMYGIGPFRTERARKWGDFPKVDKADKDKAIDTATLEMEVDFDSAFFDEESKDLLQKLLDKNPTTRLGAKGVNEIKNHPFYRRINWDMLDRALPPSKPPKDINMASQAEIGSFVDDRNTSTKAIRLDNTDKLFDSWDFTNLKSFECEVVEFLQYEELHGSIKPVGGGSDCCLLC